MRIDLHTHSLASDGTQPPAELMHAAVAAGLDVVALTDHDTTAGWDPATAALPPGLTLVPGAELSCAVAGPAGRRTAIHLLAYLFDPAEPRFAAQRARLRDHRLARGRRMVERLAADGVPISWPQVERIAAGGAVGRPHVARALVGSGLADTVGAAFDRFLYPGSPYHVPKQDLDAVTAVCSIRAAGGVAVFAHPRARRRGRVVDDAAIEALAQAGLAGLEVDHVDHDPADRAQLRVLAADLGLLATGSSDFHGTNKPVPLGACTTDPAVYERLVAAATGPVRPQTG